MTKEEFIRLLEPFTDDIPIILTEDGYEYSPRIFYTNHFQSGAKLVINIREINWSKTVEIKK